MANFINFLFCSIFLMYLGSIRSEALSNKVNSLPIQKTPTNSLLEKNSIHKRIRIKKLLSKIKKILNNPKLKDIAKKLKKVLNNPIVKKILKSLIPKKLKIIIELIKILKNIIKNKTICKEGKIICKDGRQPSPFQTNAPTVNGCGPENTPKVITKISKIVLRVFTNCCNVHDNCYGGRNIRGVTTPSDNFWIVTRKGCDQTLKNCMDRQANSHRSLKKKLLLFASKIIYQVIRQGGCNAFTIARIKSHC